MSLNLVKEKAYNDNKCGGHIWTRTRDLYSVNVAL